MPKSKRNKLVDLSKTKKHGMEGKKKLYEEVQSCIESYANLFIFSVNDMRNAKIKSVREQWRHSRFFIGKNKVMARALGNTPETEFRKNLHKIAERLKGERGLLFSNQPVEDVLKWFNSYSESDYARSGNRATETVVLNEGPLSQFPHNLEPYLRQLGLPTTLKKGVIHMISDHTVCKEGDILTPETARIVKLLGYEMSEFYIKIESVWSQDGSFTNFVSDNKANDESEVISPVSEGEEMEIAEPENLQNGNSEDGDLKNGEEEDEDEEIPQLVDPDSKDMNDNTLVYNSEKNTSLSKHDKLNSSNTKESKDTPQKELDEEMESEKEASDEEGESLPQNELSKDKEIINEASDEDSEKFPQSKVNKETKIIDEDSDKKDTEDIQDELNEDIEIMKEPVIEEEEEKAESPIVRKLRNRSIKVPKNK